MEEEGGEFLISKAHVRLQNSCEAKRNSDFEKKKTKTKKKTLVTIDVLISFTTEDLE